MVPRPQRQRRSGGIALASVAHLANDAVTSMLPALLPLLATRYDLITSEVALLVSVFAVATSLPQPFFGTLADRFGAHRVSAFGLALSALLVAGLSVVSSATELALLLLIGGLGSSALHPAGMGLTRTLSKKSPGLGAAFFTAAGMAGGAAGPVLALGVIAWWGFEQLSWTALPVLVLAALLFQFTPATRQRSPAHGISPRSVVRLVRGRIARLAVIALAANLVVLTLTSALPLWLVQQGSIAADAPVIGSTLALFWMAAAVGGLLGGTLTRWLSERNLVVLSLALSFIALQSIIASTPGSLFYFTAVIAAGMLLFVHAPLVMAQAQQAAPGAEAAVAGLLLGGTTAVAGVVYAGLGALQATVGLGAAMATVFGLVLPAAYLAARTPATAQHEPALTAGSDHKEAPRNDRNPRVRNRSAFTTLVARLVSSRRRVSP